MKKEDALKRLDLIEAEQKELRKIIESADKIDIFSIKSMDAVYKAANSSEAAITKPGDTIDEIAYKKWKLIKKVFCGDWKENWEYGNSQSKFEIIWKKQGGRFSLYCVGTYGYCLILGSRFVFPERKIAEHVAKYFENEANEMLHGL